MTELTEADMDALWRMGQTDSLVRRAFHRLRHLEGRRKFSESIRADVADKADAIRSIIADAEARNRLSPGQLVASGKMRQRPRDVLMARQEATVALHRLGLSTPAIARELGQKSHGTVLATLRRVGVGTFNHGARNAK